MFFRLYEASFDVIFSTIKYKNPILLLCATCNQMEEWYTNTTERGSAPKNAFKYVVQGFQ